MTQPQEISKGAGFPDEICSSVRQLRNQCGAIIEAVCGTGARAKDVAELFGVHSKLGWQIWNVAYSQPLSAVKFVPNEPGLKLFRRAAAERGVPRELLVGLDEAIELVREMIGAHAEDREMFEMLVDAQAGAADEDAEIKWRKQAFMGNAFMFGARARCTLVTAILYPSAKPDSFSIVRLHGLMGLIRTRVGVRWPLSSLVVQQPDGNQTAPAWEPLQPALGVEVPLLTEYCSHPLPEVERRTDVYRVCDELKAGRVGLTGASTVFTGEILHDVGPPYGMEEGDIAHFGTGVRTPSELLIYDHLVHRTLFPGAERELRVYSELISPTTRDDRDRMPVSEELEPLGPGLMRVRTADVPNYGELLTEAFARIDFDPNEFDVYRVRMRYPPIPASIMVRHLLPGPPG